MANWPARGFHLGPKSGRAIAWAALVALLGAEFIFFDVQTSKHHAWIYPRWDDQIQYLTEAYTGIEYARDHGLASGLAHAAGKPSAQGLLDDLVAIVVFWCAGPSRSAALAINMACWACLQAACFWTAVRALGSRALGWAFVGLLLCWGTPLFWQNPGSAFDFRLDFMAACAYGVALAAAINTDGLRSLRRSLLFGAAVGAALLVRFLTAPYFLVILLGMSVWILSAPGRPRRLLNLLLAAAVAAAMAAPAFWHNRDWIWNYYGIGHFIGPERAIRDSHLGVGASLRFVYEDLVHDHLQACFLSLAGAGTLLLAGGAGVTHLFGLRPKGEGPRLNEWIGPAALFAAAPALVLIFDSEKSSVVLSILVPPVAALLIGAWAWLSRWARRYLEPANARRCSIVLAASALLVGIVHFVSSQWDQPQDAAFLRDARRLNTLSDRIYAASQGAGLREPSIAVDQVTDCLDALAMRVICYERRHRWVPFRMTLPTGILESDEALIMERLAQSDFVFIAADDGVGRGFPYDRQMQTLRPKTRAWCDSHLRLSQQIVLFGRPWRLYCRPPVAAFVPGPE